MGQNFGTYSVAPPNGPPTTIPHSDHYLTGACPSGFGAIFASAKSTKGGAINLQRYADAALTIPVGAVVTVALVADTFNSVNVHDGVPSLYFQVEITNTDGAADATITQFALLTGPVH